MSAEKILAIPTTEPERLFPNSLEEAAKEYRALALKWHPDRSSDPSAAKVMAHISALYQTVLEKIKSGRWEAVGVRIFKADRKTRKINYLTSRTFELGEMLIGTNLVTFVIPTKYESYVLRGLRAAGSLHYPNKDWEKDLSGYFPKVEKYFEAEDSAVIMLRKDPSSVLLSDLIRYCGGSLDPKHTAWIISSLLNLCSFLEVSHTTHNALSPDTVFVSPKLHAAFLLGGWWYAAPTNKPLTAVPPYSHRLMTNLERERKTAAHRLDLQCIREIGLELVGDAITDLPKPYREFLRLPAPASPIKDYEAWAKVLTDSYGARRFVKLDVTPSAVYGG